MRLLGSSNVLGLISTARRAMAYYGWYDTIDPNIDCPICFSDDGEWSKPFKWSYLKQGEAHGRINDVYHLKLESRYSMYPSIEELVTSSHSKIESSDPRNYCVCDVTTEFNYVNLHVRYYDARFSPFWADYVMEVKFTTHYDTWKYPRAEYTMYTTHTYWDGRVYRGTSNGSYNLWRSPWIELVSMSANPYVSVYGLQSYISEHCDFSDNKTRELYEDCVSQIQMNTNNIANIKEILDIVSIITKPVSGLMDLCENVGKLMKEKSKGAVKAAGKAWMAYRYQYSTTLSDLYEGLRFLEDNSKIMDYRVRESDLRTKISFLTNTDDMCRTCRSGGKVNDGVAHFSMRLSRPQFNSCSESANVLMEKLWDFKVNVERYGLALNTYNIWDMIPLSFVVDWVVPIGDATESFQKDWVKDYLNITDICYSEKRSFDIVLGGIPCKGTLYTRQGLDHVPLSSSYDYVNYRDGTGADCYSLNLGKLSEDTINNLLGTSNRTRSKRLTDAFVMLYH